MSTTFIKQIFGNNEKKIYTAIYMHFAGGDDDSGMETIDIEAESKEEALQIAKKYPGTLYKLNIKQNGKEKI